jgi:protein subunit release factor B
VSVSPEKQKALENTMRRLGIREQDLVERFVRSQGHGGQKVNKTSTCVYLKHLPTGIEVKCQETRSQPLNRFLARRTLVEKVEKLLMGRRSLLEKRRFKKRKQKDRRTRKAKKKYPASGS